MEEVRRNSLRLESIGILAGGIAHNFNNLLMGVFGNLELARESLDEPAAAGEHLSDALSAFQRAQVLTNELLTFAKGGEPKKVTVSVGDVIEGSKRLALSGEAVDCVIRLPDDLWPVVGDPNQLGQVFDELLLNARQAMSDGGGNILIRGRNAGPREHEILDLVPGDYVRIEVADDGRGIAPADLPKVFAPFFSTKSNGRGLGLAIADSIIRRHGGSIFIEPRVGQGTTAVVYLPATGQPPRSEVCPASA